MRQRTLLNLGHHFEVEQIGLLKENSQGIGQHHQIELIPDHNGQNAKEIRWQHMPVKGSQLTNPGIIYHHKEVRSDGHLLITVLAYHMVQFIHHRLKECGTHVQALWIRT
jgi:hypothetical protein